MADCLFAALYIMVIVVIIIINMLLCSILQQNVYANGCVDRETFTLDARLDS